MESGSFTINLNACTDGKKVKICNRHLQKIIVQKIIQNPPQKRGHIFCIKASQHERTDPANDMILGLAHMKNK